jgi:malate dehydrogenase (oxaloacetate-decarboxylating)(NADP+)
VFDLEIDAPDPKDIIRFCEMLAPTVGGINLEDIKAPDCFEVEEVLRERLSIPVFHDDQHGTAIIAGAALLNACEITGRALDAIRVVFVGAGAAGMSTAEHFVRLGVKRENITLTDRKGVVHAGRDGLDKYLARFAHPTDRLTVAEQLVGADVFVGLSVAGAIDAQWLVGMAKDPIIFALANPIPEVTPDEVRAVRPDAIVATGRSDYPNQVNNVLGFPFIFRGALDVRASRITDEMKMAATRALASLAREDVPDSVLRAYSVESMRFGREYLIPKPFDSRVLLWVAPAVAWAAVASGVARDVVDVEEYREQLEGRIGKGRAVMRSLSNRAALEPQRVAFTDAYDTRILRAARSLAEEGIAQPVLVGPEAPIVAAIASLGFHRDEFTIVDPTHDPRRESFAERLWDRRQRSGVTREEARWRLTQPEYFASMLAAVGDVDAAILGENQHYPRAIRPALETVGAAPGATVAGIYMMVLQQGVYPLRRLHRQHRPRCRDAGRDRVLHGRVRGGTGPRAARGDAFVLELRLGAPSQVGQGGRGRAAAARAPPGPGGGRRDAGRHRRRRGDPDAFLPVQPAAAPGERAHLSGPRRCEHLLQAARPPRRRAVDRADPRRDGGPRCTSCNEAPASTPSSTFP